SGEAFKGHDDHEEVVGDIPVGQAEEGAADEETQETDLDHPAEVAYPNEVFTILCQFLESSRQPVGSPPQHQVEKKSDESVIPQDLEVDAVGDQHQSRRVWGIEVVDEACRGGE